MDHDPTITKPQTLFTKTTKNRLNDIDNDEEEECDEEVWEMLSKSFIQVQSVLDQNRVLINQVNENHQSKIADNLAKNVALIREINTNISKVLSIYSDLSLNFSTIVHQRQEERRRQSLNMIADEKFQDKAAGMLIYIYLYPQTY